VDVGPDDGSLEGSDDVVLVGWMDGEVDGPVELASASNEGLDDGNTVGLNDGPEGATVGPNVGASSVPE
jgi:hypothetical protein